MENFMYEGANQIKIERFLLGIYTIYDVIMIIVSMERMWDNWVSILLLAGLASSWLVNVSKVKDYKFRARFTAVMMQLSIVVYTTCLDDVVRVLPILGAYIVFMGLYGMPEIVNITIISIMFIFFYHGMIIKTIPCETVADIVNILLQFGNMVLLEYVVYVWTRRNSEGSRRLMGTIEELEAAEHSKDDFLANVSHEIRTPINTICGMSEIVLKEEVPHNVKENFTNIQLAGRNLMAVVSDVLDFSELQSGKMELEEEAYNITSTINDVINMTLARKNEKKIELIVDCNANIPCALMGDEKKIRRVIMKLVDNAIKFTDEGYVSINIGYRKESYGINLIISVKDTGIGMKEESLEKLFTSFNQVDASRNRQEGGIGLGLAISQALVQKMGGVITVKSKLGKGTIVQFVVPQKVLDETPIASISNRGNINVATFIDMEQFDMVEIRDEYSSTIVHMVEQLKGRCHICRNFPELQRREKKESFSHIFISIVEYKAETAYFDELAKKTKVIVVLDQSDEKHITNPEILKIYKPFYILTIVSVLNGQEDSSDSSTATNNGKFVTNNAHVLVVDDNRMNLRVIEGLLEEYNIKVTKAHSGQEALEKITSADYDFVFMDHMMPEMDGVETMQHIRHKVGTYYQKVPIVALTANAVAGTREMMLKEGFNDFLEKPVERSVLERVLKRNIASEKIIFKEDYSGYAAYHEDALEAEKMVITSARDVIVEKTQEEEIGEIPTIAGMERILGAKGIDVQKGILYCNGKERYIEVLQGYCEDCDDTGVLAEQLFEKEDWKNYTIAVHGMKSAMHSIGALTISEMAKRLEFAGKEGRISYIKENHAALMKEYKKLFKALREIEWISPVEINEEVTKTPEAEIKDLEKSEFDRMLSKMETAMYTLEEERLMEIVSELQNYRYCGTALKDMLVQVKRKMEMSDYISAVEMVERIKSSLESKE